jgi:tRNA_anti-like
MKSNLKKGLLAVVVLAVLGGAYAWYQWNKPARDAKDEKGLVITADALFTAYSANQVAADSMYLDKTIEVSGEIIKMGLNQEGQQHVELKTSQDNGTVFCTLKEKKMLKEGQPVTLKGICKGYRDQMLFFDVVLTDCYLLNEPNK